MSEKIYCKGLIGFQKKENQPDFVIGSMVISLNDLFKFAKDNPNLLTDYKGTKQLKLQMLKGNDGKINCMVDTFVPTPQQQPPTSFPHPSTPTQSMNDSKDDLPF